MNARALRSCWFFLAALFLSFTVFAKDTAPIGTVSAADLPIEARKTMELIKQGGPFPYPKDGAVFGNHERVLPRQKRGYYHEFTVKTAGVRNRGARRMIVGGDPAAARNFYYTDDHYATFRRVKE